jgi:DNA-directed RNA polymerase specialized sigma24 family protein
VRQHADEIYDGFLKKLRKFFEYRSCEYSDEDLAEETLLRVAAKFCEGRIGEGEPSKIIIGFARKLRLEHLDPNRRPERKYKHYAIEELDEKNPDWELKIPGRPMNAVPIPLGDDDLAMWCLESCLAEFSGERDLLIEWHWTEGRPGDAKRIHAEMTARLGITPEAMRTRVSRALGKVEECTRKCVEAHSGGSTGAVQTGAL